MDNKFKKHVYTEDELNYLRTKFTFEKILIRHSVSAISVFFILVFINFFPFLPHPKYGYGVENSSSLPEYFRLVGRGLIIILGFVLFLILFTTTVDYIRVLIDISCKFKKVGNFQVKEIVEGDDVKLIRLKGGPKLKIKSSEPFFERVKKEDVVEITRTATNRFVSFKIMTE